jgi:hypothetical protein
LTCVNDGNKFFPKIVIMSRNRIYQTAKEIEEDFPYCVDIAVPPRGLGWRLAAMYDFHARHRISPKRGCGQRGAIRWCFADRALADAFAQEFLRDQKLSPVARS